MLAPEDYAEGGRHEWLGLAGVLVAHVAVLGGLAVMLKKPTLSAPPTVVGVLVPQEVVEPQPLPVQPQLQPRPVVKPRPLPPVPEAPPSERAITAPPPEPQPPAALPTSEPPLAPVALPAPVAAPAPVEPPAPVVPPRSDAAHLANPAPVYPNISRRLGEQGRVLLDVYILADGSVGEIKLKSSSGHARLDAAALDAVRHWRYLPARRGDIPIAYWYVQPMAFSLER